MKHRMINCKQSELVNGFAGDKVQFEWRPFNERAPEAQTAYLKLKASLLKDGMRDPLITHCGHVLVGMRRFEILSEVNGSDQHYRCAEIDEDVENWDRDDVVRLDRFKTELYGAGTVKEFMPHAVS